MTTRDAAFDMALNFIVGLQIGAGENVCSPPPSTPPINRSERASLYSGVAATNAWFAGQVE